MSLQNRHLGYVEGALSIIVNTTLFFVKLAVGRSVGSIAITADAWHTLSDSVTSLAVIAGYWIANRPKDTDHPFGHGRAEIIVAVIIGTLLAVVGITFLKESYHQLQEHSAVVFSVSTIVVFSASVVLKEGLAQFSIRAGRRAKSHSLVADGWHHRSDAIASALIIAGALLGRRIWWVDGVFGIGVSLLIVYTAFQIIRDSVNPLMGERPDEATLKKIRDLACNCAPIIQDVHHVHIHRYGAHGELTLHALVPGGTSLQHAHEIASDVEERIRRDLNLETTVHIEPNRDE